MKYLFAIWMFLSTSAVQGVIISGGGGTGNTTAPTGDQGFSLVGSINTAPSSATYVGNDWFLTAWHVRQLDNPTQVYLNDAWYTIDGSSWNRLSSGGNNADAVLFQVTSSVAQSNATLYTGIHSVGDSVTITGNGRNRAASSTTWYVDEDPITDTWSESDVGIHERTETGFKWASGTSKRWGTNELVNSTLLNTGYGISESIYFDFDDNGDSNEAHGATYDSGGGVFYNDGGTWSLTGMTVAVNSFEGQPGGTAVYGNRTYYVDLRAYNEQIAAITAVPEIGSLLMAGIVMGTAYGLSRFRRVRNH